MTAMIVAQKYETRAVAISELKPHPKNYVHHPEDQIAHLIESLTEHGFYRNIIIAKDNTILAGHGIVEAAKRLGIKTAPCVRLDIAPDDPRALKVVIGDNEISHLREIDDRALTELLAEIQSADAALLGTGYDEAMLANLLLITRPEIEIDSLDAAKEWAGAGMPEHIDGKHELKVVILFRSEKNRTKCMKILGVKSLTKANRSTGSFWWPPEDA